MRFFAIPSVVFFLFFFPFSTSFSETLKPQEEEKKKIKLRPMKNFMEIKALEKGQKKSSEKDPNRFEWGLLPAINYSSDTGIGVGVITNFARFGKDAYPYKWRIQALLYLTLLPTETGVLLPYHEDYIKVDLPRFLGSKVRLNAEFSFKKFSTARYHGIGNNSPDLNPTQGLDPETDKVAYQLAKKRYQFDRTYPSVDAFIRYPLAPNWLLFGGGTLTYNLITPYQGSKLQEDIHLTQSQSQSNVANYLRDELRGTQNHLLFVGYFGGVFDSRNNEITPSKGMFHDISFRGSPVSGLAFGGLNLTTRFFLPLWKEYFVLALRFIGDWMFGQVPFYEMAKFGGLFPNEGPGGSSSTRGVPSLRYYGKAKLIGNLELRIKAYDFMIKSSRFNLGFILFGDIGRVWSGVDSIEELDADVVDGQAVGSGPVKYGVGGGIRFQWGETFVIRADFAWSPDQTLGVYINVNHIF